MHAVPPDEPKRLAALRGLGLLDTGHEERFDRITRLAAALLDVPIALVTLVDGERHWFKSAFGIDVVETPRDSLSFCGHAIQSDAQFIVPDTLADPLFCGNPLVTGGAGIRFYAGRPLKTTEGSRVGTLCVMARKPHTLTAAQSAMLEDLAAIAEDELNHVRRDGTLRARLAAIVENSNDGIYSRKLDGTVLSWNAGAERMLGYTAAEAIGQSITLSLPTGHRPRLTEHNAALLRGQVIAHESTRKSKDGRIVDVWASVSPIRDGAGNVTGASVILQNMTALKQAQAAVKENEQNLAITLQSIGDAVIATDAAGLVTRMNPAAEHLTGWPLAEAVGRPSADVFRIFNTSNRAPADNPVQLVVARGEVVGLANHTLLIARDGREYQIADSAAPIRDTSGKIIGVVMVFSDVTQRYRMEAKLRASELRLRSIIETAPQCVKVVSPEGNLLEMNAAGLAMLEAASLEEVRARLLLDFITPEHRADFAALHQRVMRGEKGTLAFEVIGLRGTRRWLETHAAPMPDADTGVTLLLGITQDITERKKAEREQAQLAAIVETTNDAIVGRAPDDTIISWNAAAERMFGWTAAEVLGKSFRTLLSLTPEASKRKRFEKALRGETAATAEDTRRRKDGASVVVDTTLSAVKNANGEVLFVSCIMRDVTERKRIEESRAQLAAIVENSNDAIYSRTLDGTILLWNGGAEKMLGYAAAEAIGKTTSIILPSDRPQYLPENNAAVLRGEVYVRNSNRITKDGRILDVVSSHSPIFDASGSINGVAVILRDVTALKRAQAALQESEERFRLTFDQAAAGMVLIGLDQRYIIANQKFASMTGYTCAELQGMPTAGIGYASDSDEVTIRQQQQLLDGEIDSINAERRFVRKDGKVFSVRRTLSLARDATGKPLYFVGMSEDISERREMEERYRATFDNAPVGIMHTAIDGYTILHANRKLCEMLGYTLDELLHMTSTDLVHPDFRFKDLPRYKDPLIRGEFSSFSSERKYLRKDGSVIWVKRTLSLVNDATGNPLYFIRIVEDITERKQAEEARSRLAAVAEGSADAIFIRDVEGKIVYWNEAAARIYGYRPEEVMGKSSDFLVPPDWLEERRINWERLQQGIPVENFETVRRRKDGALLDVSISVSVVKDPHGKIIGAATVARDITERKQAEAVRGYLAAIVNSSNDAIISRSLERKVLSWNNAAERLFGYTAAEVIGTDVSFLIPPDREAEARISRERVTSGLPVVNLETVRLTKDGRRIDVTMSQSSVIDERGSMIGVALIFRDNSERKRAEATRALLATIVDNATDAIASRTLDGTIMSWNAAAEKMFGYTAAEVIGQPLTIIMPAGLEYMVEHHSRLLAAGKPVPSADVTRRSKDGRALAVRRSISPIRNAAQQVIGAAVIMHDISELKQAEETRASLEAQLRESHKMQAIGTLAGGIAHDFNNIIAIVLGNLDLARQDAAHVPQALESLERIQLASERARALVQQILAFSRRQPTARIPVNLATIVADTERLLRATMPARIHFSVDCDPATPQVLADAMQIQQVLINLATNAMQALRDSTGRITLQLDSVVLDERMIESHSVLREIRARHPGAAVRLRVSDDGAGMDATTLERVFEPFFTTRPAGEGTGLGLSVVLGIVQAHDGAITVESRPQQGTTFTLYFPPATSPAYAPAIVARPAGATATVAAPAAASDAQRKAHVLYIDDDADLAYLMKRLLERRGYEISTYIDPHAALNALSADPADVDLVLTDYNMPGMSGLDVARAVRDIRADIQIAVTSGFIDETLQSQAASAGVAELIFKADSVEALCDAVQRLVDKAT